MNKLLVYIVLILSYLISIPSFGQTLLDTISIKEIIINAQRKQDLKCIKQQHLDSLMLANNLNANLSDLLAANSPVFIKSYGQGALATASFRGTDASHTKVLWNDVPVNSPMLGQVDFATLPLYFIDDVSLQFGAASLVKGSGSLGGSISIDNKPDWNNKISLQITQDRASFETYNSSLKFSIGSPTIQCVTRIFYKESANNFPYLNTTILPEPQMMNQQNANYSQYGFMQELNKRLNNNQFISLTAWYFNSKRNLPSIMTNVERGDNIEKQSDQSFRLLAKWNKFFKNSTLSIQSCLLLDSLDYSLYHLTKGGNYYSTYSKSLTIGNASILKYYSKLKYDINLNANLSFNYYSASIYEEIQNAGYNKDRTEASFMLKLDKNITSRLTNYLLLRQEGIDFKSFPLIASTGVDYKLIPSKDLYLKVSIANNYHQPTLNDLYWLPGGNLNLRPEKGVLTEIGLEYISKHFKTEITGFYSVISDWIIWQPTNYSYSTPLNLQNVHARGIEYMLTYCGSIKNVDLRLIANYALTFTTNETGNNSFFTSTGNQLIYIPQHNFNLFGNANWKNFSFNYLFKLTGERYINNDPFNTNRDRLPLNSINDISVGKKFVISTHSLAFLFKVNNIFDVNYQAISLRAMAGRNYMFSIKYLFRKS